jgi:predicted MFS family arabinose efflux permease
VPQQGKSLAARIFTTRRLRYTSFIAPFFYIVCNLLFHVLDRSWPWLVLAIVFGVASIAAFQVVRQRASRSSMPDESDDAPAEGHRG